MRSKPIALKTLDNRGRILISQKIRENIQTNGFLIYYFDNRIILEGIK